MSQETQPQQAESQYLGMNQGQFGMLMSLTSLSRQMEQLVSGQDMTDLMVRLITEHPEKTVEDNLGWVRGQRNHILNVLHAVLVSQNMLAQIDDALVAQLQLKNADETATEQTA